MHIFLIIELLHWRGVNVNGVIKLSENPAFYSYNLITAIRIITYNIRFSKTTANDNDVKESFHTIFSNNENSIVV